MAKEIERKFLVNDDSFKQLATAKHHICQAYISADPDGTVRVRIKDDKAFITVKTRNHGCVRNEWEYEIPLSDAKEMIAACRGGVIDKTRYIIPADNGLVWEIDEFHGRHQGLVVAEIELPSEDASFALPAFIGQEVTGNPAYYNSSLSQV